MNKKLIILVAVLAFLSLTSCSYIEKLELPSLPSIDGENILDDYSNEQESALTDFKDGASNVFNLMKDGLFSLKELTELGILDDENPLESLGELIDNNKSFSMSDIDISSLNIENLTEEQITMLMKVISGEMTMTELITSGTFTLKDFQDMGLFDVIIDNINRPDNTNSES